MADLSLSILFDDPQGFLNRAYGSRDLAMLTILLSLDRSGAKKAARSYGLDQPPGWPAGASGRDTLEGIYIMCSCHANVF